MAYIAILKCAVVVDSEMDSRYGHLIEHIAWTYESVFTIKTIQANCNDLFQGVELSVTRNFQVIRKERAVGVVPQAPTVYEVLEEIVITVQAQLVDAHLPFCAFNGGADVFVDVGNKSLGLEALMKHLSLKPHQASLLSDKGAQSYT